MLRVDLSNRLIHLTKAVTDRTGNETEDAFSVFLNIINEQKLRGGTGFIKSGDECVCFSEAPISALGQFLADDNRSEIRYQPFGIMFKKAELFKKGARPVIYQEEARFGDLPEYARHLHVRFELGSGHPIDFTWEREWRLKAKKLKFGPEEVTLILPNRHYSDAFLKHHFDAAQGAGEPEVYPWHHIVLEDLGLPYERF